MPKNEAHLSELVDKYQSIKENMKIDSPSIDRVKIDHLQYSALFSMSANLFLIESVSISVPNLFKLAHVHMNDFSESDIKLMVHVVLTAIKDGSL